MLVVKFSNLFRYPFSAESHVFIELQKELKFIEEYLEIEKVRLDDRLQYEIKVDDELLNFKIPGMILQPIVENSIIHGISQMKSGGEVSIKCFMQNSNCVIEVIDNGKVFNFNNISSGFGISGVKERLELLYGSKDLLSIVRDQKTKVSITIPNES